MIKTIGIELDNHSMKSVELSKFFINRVRRAYSKIIPQECFTEGIVQDCELAIDFLKEFKKEACIKSRKVSIAVGGNNLILRQFSMPEMSKKELSEAVKWEAAEYLPIPMEEVVIDFIVLGKDADNKKIKVMVAAIPERIILDYFKVFKAAGLDIQRVEIPHISLFRVFGGIFKKESCAVVNMGKSMTEISILDKGQYHSGKTMNKGSEIFSQIINMKANPISKMLLEEYMDEIKRFFDFYTAQTKGLRLDRIQLTGSGVYLPGVKDLFEDNLEYPIGSAFPRKILNTSKCEEFNSRSHIYTTALGLCLGGGVCGG